MTYVIARLTESIVKGLMRDMYNSFGRYFKEKIPTTREGIHLYAIKGDVVMIDPQSQKHLRLITPEESLEGIEKKIKDISSEINHRFVIESIN